MTRENSLRGKVILRWDKARKPNWNLKETIKVCTDVNNELEASKLNPAPK
jgi:hypothetical protein